MSKNILSRVLAAVVLTLCCASAAAKGENLRLMTFNSCGSQEGTHSWEARKKACLKVIKKQDPDIICLQEASYAQKTDLGKEFKKLTLVDRGSKPGTIDPDIPFNENPIMFRADKFELLDYGFFWLGDEPGEEEDTSSPRTTTWVKLRFKKSGRIFFCFNTQFGVTESEGKRGSLIMVDKIKEIAGDDAVVFLGGDFAMSSSDRDFTPLSSYMEDINYALKKPSASPSYNGFGKSGGSVKWPDHIFMRNAIARSYTVLDGKAPGVKYISSHYPVFAEVTIPATKRK